MKFKYNTKNYLNFNYGEKKELKSNTQNLMIPIIVNIVFSNTQLV